MFQSESFYAINKLQLGCQRERYELLFVHRHRQSGFSARGFSFAYSRLRIQAASAFSFAWRLYADSGYVAPNLSLIHISEPTRLGMISYAVFCLKKKNK